MLSAAAPGAAAARAALPRAVALLVQQEAGQEAAQALDRTEQAAHEDQEEFLSAALLLDVFLVFSPTLLEAVAQEAGQEAPAPSEQEASQEVAQEAAEAPEA